MADQHNTGTDAYITNLIRKKAKELASEMESPFHDAEDIEQELWMHLERKKHLYDPARASFRTFANRVIINKVRSIWRADNTDKRHVERAMTSLDDIVYYEDGETLTGHDVIADPKAPKATDTDRRLDMEAFINRLEPDDQQIARRFLEDLTQTRTAKSLKISRRQVRAALDRMEKVARDMRMHE